MAIDTWDEIRTAWHVARVGTVSGAAEALGVHHATVIRHVDALEGRLGVKLFQRHPKGYTPTEAGQALAQVGRSTEDQFAQLEARLSGLGRGISGELVITALPELCEMILPALVTLVARHPDLRPRLRTERRVLRLEYGEAHVAVRAGAQPSEPDNVVQLWHRCRVGLYASAGYLERHGTPRDDADLEHHVFVGDDTEDTRAPFFRWLAKRGFPQIFRSNEPAAQRVAIEAGLGLGFLFEGYARGDLVQVMAPRPDWDVPLWLVTHVDLHRTPKVQAALDALKAGAPE
ncbi:MAG: Transcriptional regulator [Rhodobacteraceae bacterium HLUCCA12]|nr:MAG: Transcriptional regulator [Rhodobacteraceae bacterium HLUCCA12]